MSMSSEEEEDGRARFADLKTLSDCGGGGALLLVLLTDVDGAGVDC